MHYRLIPMMTPRVRRFALTAHVTVSVGWHGAGAAFLALAIAALMTKGSGMVGEPTLSGAPLPLCVMAGVTGLILLLLLLHIRRGGLGHH